MTVHMSKIDAIIKSGMDTKMDAFNKFYEVALSKFVEENAQHSCCEALNDDKQLKYLLGVIPSVTGNHAEDRTYIMTINMNTLNDTDSPEIGLMKFKTVDGADGNSIDIESLEQVDCAEFIGKLKKLEQSLTRKSERPGLMLETKQAIVDAGTHILDSMNKVKEHHTPPNSPRNEASQDESREFRKI